jgi:hypothetical protein
MVVDAGLLPDVKHIPAQSGITEALQRGMKAQRAAFHLLAGERDATPHELRAMLNAAVTFILIDFPAQCLQAMRLQAALKHRGFACSSTAAYT